MTSKKQVSKEIIEKILQLEEKFQSMGQDLSAYLEGLLHADYLTYWDYIHLDTLLNLQKPKTKLPDEMVFIGYHQITELYFKLILWELDQICLKDTEMEPETFLIKIQRVNNYFKQLTSSFDIMVDGMEKEQFLKFRMSLLPSSGFQSFQFRLIELYCTDLRYLTHPSFKKEAEKKISIEYLYDHMYWKEGATELATQKKTLTLKHFEDKYSESFLTKAEKLAGKTLNSQAERYLSYPSVKESLKELDVLANITWKLAHFKSAVRYLHRSPDAIAATGGTNWQKYLPPRYQKIIFFPSLWTSEEKEEWGKSWVLENIEKA